MKKIDTKREERNGYLLAAFLFQYSILIPLMAYVNSSLLVAVTGLLLLFTLFFRNIRTAITIKIILFFLCCLIILSIKVILSGSDVELIVLFVSISGPAMFMFLYKFSYKSFLTAGYKLAIINFFVICIIPITKAYNYMRFGYGMLLTVIFLYIRVVYLRKNETEKPGMISILFEGVLLFLALLEMVVYGSRGALFAFILLVVIDRLLVNKKNIGRILIMLLLGVALYLNIGPLLNLLEVVSKKVGLYSYSITKLKMQLLYGFNAASSGRDKLYADAISKIRQHPFLGNKVIIDEEGGYYVHNIFLQVAQDLGLLALIILVVFLIFVLIRIWKDKTRLEEKIALELLFSISIGRLMFSSTLWRRPELWMLIAFTLAISPGKQRAVDRKALSNSQTVIPTASSIGEV